MIAFMVRNRLATWLTRASTALLMLAMRISGPECPTGPRRVLCLSLGEAAQTINNLARKLAP